MKTFVITVSKNFPQTHKRKGELTYFEDKIMKRYSDFNNFLEWVKIHTIRANYELWKKRLEQVKSGEAILSIRYWSGKPYNSKQIEICKLDKSSGCGVQELKFVWKDIMHPWLCSEKIASGNLNDADFYTETIAKNDGLSLEDFKEWFKNYDLSKPLAIIHFTDFRY